MASVKGVTNKMKEVRLEEENQLLRQWMITLESSSRWYNAGFETRMIFSKVMDEFEEFDDNQAKWNNRSTELRETISKPCSCNNSLLQQFKLACNMLKRVQKEKNNFLKCFQSALEYFVSKEAKWTDPAVLQFESFQEMSSKKRKKLLKKCKSDDEIVQETMTTFNNLKDDWNVIKVELEECMERFEKMYAIHRAVKNQ
ncbi:unnamed protein product [Orchesella dallaii]|uniref:Uncharacterized protein n=1 Tax=Orchesella dallaii TaxID=48710 RepID=A0ABP1R9W8_9HEXA